MTTVPAKLIKAQNTVRASYQDAHFAAVEIKYLKDFATQFGPKIVSVIIQDDKSRVLLGVPAAKKTWANIHENVLPNSTSTS